MDFAAGAAAGWSETIIGFPFLTVKCLQQNNQKWFPLPFKRYYRGVKYPFFSSIGFNMIIFPLKDRTYQHTNSYVLSGIFTGAVIAPIVYGIDMFTIRKQTGQPLEGLKMFKGIKGLGATFGKETIATAAYFSTYHALRDDYGSFIAGGMAGLANWTLSFPLDTIKTRQLSKQITFEKAFSEGRLWTGFRITAIRSVIVNSLSFTVYEKALMYLK